MTMAAPAPRLTERGLRVLGLVAACSFVTTPACDDDQGRAGPAAAGAAHLRLQWDTRYDTAGFFAAGERRALLDHAARTWAALVRDDFWSVASGTEILVRNPEAPNVPGALAVADFDIDDVAVFVGLAALDGPGGQLAGSRPSAAIGSVSDLGVMLELAMRFNGPDFEPWTGWLTLDRDEPWYFDTTPDDDGDLPADAFDAWTVLMHELGHVLGIGTCEAFNGLVDASGKFVGARAVAAHGGPVPLSADRMHVAPGVLSDGRAPLMDPGEELGLRARPTPLDLAILADIGYELAPARAGASDGER